MTDTVLKDVYISKGQVDRYFEGRVPVHLWRALNARRGVALFDFVEQPTTLSNGRLRPPDITIVDRKGTKWVSVRSAPRGISTFDKPGVPPGKDWSYYRIGAGTVLPHGLAIVRDALNEQYGATHYTIAPAFDMPLEQFKHLLLEVAKNAIKEAA